MLHGAPCMPASPPFRRGAHNTFLVLGTRFSLHGASGYGGDNNRAQIMQHADNIFARAALFRLNSGLNMLTDDNILFPDMMCNYMARSFRVCYCLVINDSYRVMNAGSENCRASSWRNSSNRRRSLGKQQKPDIPPVNSGAQAGTATPPATSLL